MLNRLDELVRAEQVQDIIRQVERLRLQQQALEARRWSSTRFYSPALAWLGRWLELWGCRLQTRYGTITKAGVIRPASNGRGGRS